MNDKNSVIYFMTQVTQNEFSELLRGHKVKKYEFNRINQPERSKREDSQEALTSDEQIRVSTMLMTLQ